LELNSISKRHARAAVRRIRRPAGPRGRASQAAFARLPGLTARQVNNWCRGRAAVPPWAAALAALLDQHSQDAIEMIVDEALFSWRETLGVPLAADAAVVRRTMTRLALAYHPDKGGT
jgi:DNA-binding transcriptional regulator YiaG